MQTNNDISGKHFLSFEAPVHNTRASQTKMICNTCKANGDATSFIVWNWYKPYCSKNEEFTKEHQSEVHEIKYDEKFKMYCCTFKNCALISLSEKKKDVCEFSYEAACPKGTPE